MPFVVLQPIHTERLVLREPTVADAADVLLFRGDAEVQRYNDEPLRTVEESEAFIEHLLAETADLRRHWALELHSRVIGLMGLHSWQRWHRRAELGYDIAREHWGNGYAAEAAHSILRYGFTTMRLHRIQAHTIADNHRSVRLLTSLGFTREGTMRDFSLELDGHYHDSAVFGLLRPQWSATLIQRGP
ncbi:GNAT family N-acetyltransferase [Dactylosporangium darangshiense]|uniref:GNAT family N-acetyltransferase n=1 Tax=Dactylosporangium darangshiense TaxID=579108 RepID=A0ABP8DJY6_9ACTN